MDSYPCFGTLSWIYSDVFLNVFQVAGDCRKLALLRP